MPKPIPSLGSTAIAEFQNLLFDLDEIESLPIYLRFQAVRREVMEEAGLEVRRGSQLAHFASSAARIRAGFTIALHLSLVFPLTSLGELCVDDREPTLAHR